MQPYTLLSEAASRMLQRASSDGESPSPSPTPHQTLCSNSLLVFLLFAGAFSVFAFTYLTINLWNHGDNEHNVPTSNITDIDTPGHGNLRSLILGEYKIGSNTTNSLFED